MSGGRESSSTRNTFLGRFIDSFRRTTPQVRQQQRPIEEDLGLKTLRNVYSQYINTEEPADKERRLYTMLPLFLKNCSRLKGSELVTKFPECLEFSEHVALLFVRHVTQIAQTYGMKASEALLKFLEVENADGEVETGMLMLKVLQVGQYGELRELTQPHTHYAYCVTVQVAKYPTPNVILIFTTHTANTHTHTSCFYCKKYIHAPVHKIPVLTCMQTLQHICVYRT